MPRRRRSEVEDRVASGRWMAEYVLRLVDGARSADVEALSDAELADELRRLLAEGRSTRDARAALTAIDAQLGSEPEGR